EVVVVVEMKQRAVGHRLGQIQRPAAVGPEVHPDRQQRALRVEPGFEPGQKRMAMAGDHHVLVAIETHTHRPARVLSRQRRLRAASACARVSTGGSGSYWTTTLSAAARQAAGDSPTTNATTWLW